MKRKTLAAVVAVCTLLISGPATFAQDSGPTFRPLEMWACQYNDGNDQEDMNEVYDVVREVVGDNRYASWQLNPFYVGNLVQDFDFIYIGTWADGSTMGTDLQNDLDNGSQVGSALSEAATCASLMFASTGIHTPDMGGDGTGSFIMSISDCNVAHGRTAGQAMGALRRFGEYRAGNGSPVFMRAWFPVYGGGNAEFDFKLITVHQSAQAMGDNFSWYVDNEAYNVENAMTDGLVSCDEARLYNGRGVLNNMN